MPSADFSIEFRPARLSDLPEIVSGNLALAAETENLQLDAETVTRGVRALLTDPQKGRYFVAEREGRVIGQIMHTREWSDWRNGDLWWIQSVYVVPDHRGAGVFRRLYATLSEMAEADQGVVGLRLYVEQHNVKARAVYERLGLKAAGYDVMEHVWRNAPPGLSAGRQTLG